MCSFQTEKDKLTGALIGLARTTDGNEHLISESSTQVIVEGLYATHPDVNSDSAELERLMKRVEQEKRKMVPNCFTCASPCGKNDDYDMENLRNADEDIRALKEALLRGIRDVVSNAYHASVLVHQDKTVDYFLYKALTAVGIDGWERDGLLSIVREMKEVSLKFKAVLESGKPES